MYARRDRTHIGFAQSNRSHESIAHMPLVRFQVNHTQNLSRGYHDVRIRHEIAHNTMGGAHSAALSRFTIGLRASGCVRTACDAWMHLERSVECMHSVVSATWWRCVRQSR